MRVISGFLKGRIFDSPRGHKTHPMSEKMRGAIFNVLGDITGLTIFDAFSGSGAIAIEAVSRGAKLVIAIDLDKDAAMTITKNIKDLNILDKVHAIQTATSSWSRANALYQFDIVVADPPYDHISYETIEKIQRHVKVGGIYVLSLPSNSRLILPSEYELIKKKTYGSSILVFYRRNK